MHHYSFLSSFADHAVVPEASCVAIPADVPLEIAGLVGCAVTTGLCAVWRSAGARPGQRGAVIGCGGVGLSAVMGLAAVGASPIVAVDIDGAKLETALEMGATDAVEWAGSPEATAERVQAVTGGGVDVALEATGRGEAMLAAFLCTRRRGTAVFIGIPREDTVVPLPALSIPRMERRVIGALYGSARPERDFLVILDQYRRGRLPLDGLISAPPAAGGDRHRVRPAAAGHGPPLGDRPEGSSMTLDLDWIDGRIGEAGGGVAEGKQNKLLVRPPGLGDRRLGHHRPGLPHPRPRAGGLPRRRRQGAAGGDGDAQQRHAAALFARASPGACPPGDRPGGNGRVQQAAGPRTSQRAGSSGGPLGPIRRPQRKGGPAGEPRTGAGGRSPTPFPPPPRGVRENPRHGGDPHKAFQRGE